MKLLTIILEFLLYSAIIALLVAPFILVVTFPEQAPHFVEIAKTSIPWIAVLVLFLLFNKSVHGLFGALTGALSRIRRIETKGAIADLDPQIQGAVSLTPEQVQELRSHIEALRQQTQTQGDLAWGLYLRYIGSTIFRSQYELLQSLESSGPKRASEVLRFYNTFISRAPEGTDYPFHSWVEFLTSNLLIQFNAAADAYELTEIGRRFIGEMHAHGVEANRFNY